MFTISGGYIYLNADQRGGPRSSFNGWHAIPEYRFNASWGVGADFKLTNRVLLQIIPGDYVLTNPSVGPLHHYAAQAGLALDSGSK